jgi:hypothetical protein
MGRVCICETCKSPFESTLYRASGRRGQLWTRFCSTDCRLVKTRGMRRMAPRLCATIHPSTLDIAWAAGVYEGEGHCTRSAGAVSVSQKDTWILERLRVLFGGSIMSGSNGHASLWHISGPRACGFIYTIFSYLSPRRREQARCGLMRHRLSYGLPKTRRT